MKAFKNIFLFVLFILSINSIAQDLPLKPKKTKVNTIWDIPHKTPWEKWMWIHRVVTYQIIKERPKNYDTTYIKSYYKQLVITIPVSTRFLQFSLIDFKSGKRLTYVPNLEYDLGISTSSRWASFILHTGVKLFTGDNNIKGKTNYHDVQLNLYGRKFTTDMFFQSYSGFYIANSDTYDNYVSDKPYAIRPDVKALNMGVSSYYIVNHKKFTYKNSFTFVEQQKKSAGSFLLGLYYSFFNASSKSSLVSDPFRSSFDSLSLIRNGHTQNFGISIGYIYTLVFFKKCYATTSLVQGFGGQQVAYERDDKTLHKYIAGGAGKLNVRLALGYDQGRYFIGAMGMFDYYIFKGSSNSTFDYSFGKIMVYTGYRFSVLKSERKLLRRLKLVDY